MFRAPILAAARSSRVRAVIEHAPLSRSVVQRFVAGGDTDDAVAAARRLLGEGLRVSFDHLGEDTLDAGQAENTVKAYLALLARLVDENLAAEAEVSVKLTAVGLDLDTALGLDNARRIADAAHAAGTTMTVDMEDHTRTDATLAGVAELRRDFPETGAVLQAYLRRTEQDCRVLAIAGSRVRLCKGAYAEPASVAFQSRAEVDASYARCLAVLMAGPGYPMAATHDPALIALTGRLAAENGRGPDSFEYQLLFGVRPGEQKRLAEAGATVRVYLPYGSEWYGYLMRRLAERPANITFFLRAMASRG
ncbi:MAG TPA: proline dehydrogenase family protein [Mycobacteriales bacterium]|nr:proline dehydrogenase family protein [Mycobacteriales bacterium]